MFFPESDTIATKFTGRRLDVEKIDDYIAKRGGQSFYAGQAADSLHLGMHNVQSVLPLYVDRGVLRMIPVWICPDDGRELHPSETGSVLCIQCEREYVEDECEHKTLYEPVKSEALAGFLERARIAGTHWARLDTWILSIIVFLLGILGNLGLSEPWAKLAFFVGLVPLALASIDSVSERPRLRLLITKRERHITDVTLKRLIRKHSATEP